MTEEQLTIAIWPGQQLILLICQLIGLDPAFFPPEVFRVFSGIVALFLWAGLLRLGWDLLLRVLRIHTPSNPGRR